MTPDTNPTPGFLLPWAEYSDADVFANLTNIRNFTIIVQYPQFLSDSTRIREAIADRLFEETYAILEAAKIGRFDTLTRINENGRLGVRYGDDDLGFAVVVDSDCAVHVSRSGSSLERFYRWYCLFMPHADSLVSAVTAEFEKALNFRQGSELRVMPTRAAYSFEFLIHNFKKANGRKRERNSRPISTLLSKVPGTTGQPVPFTEDLFPELGRIDISISRWNSSPSGQVRETFKIEAPSNRDYGALWLEFHYVGETEAKEAPPRGSVDFEQFFNRYDIPLNDFLHRNCLVNFVSSLTDGLSFDAVTAWLP